MYSTNNGLKVTKNIVDVLFKLLLILVMAFPFFWMLSTALQTLKETVQVPPTIWPEKLQWVNFTEVFKTIPVDVYLKNSLIVCTLVVFLQFLIIVPCAYSLAKYDYKAKPFVFCLVLVGQMIPMQMTFLPVYFMLSKAGLINSYASLVLPFISNPFGIFMLRQYFMQIPSEIIEAARLDDTSDIKIMFKIMMPMVKSAIVTIGLLSFITNWNNYFWALIMTNTDSIRTLPIGISLLKNAETLARWNVIMAGNLLLVMPMLGLYIFASKKIRNAFVYSGIK